MDLQPKLLIVDDEERFCKSMAKTFKTKGVVVKSVGSGEDALVEVSENDYDVILLDVKMSGISGIETLKRLKAQGCHAEVIILTGHASMDIALNSIDYGAYDYLLKPCDVEEISLKISQAYERKLENEKIR
ncbi:MAG: response regulator [Proteobacteria bacterium]|nr:response regulator [Pseudomonadota bacterium]